MMFQIALVILLKASDEDSDDTSFRDALMRLFFADISSTGIDKLSRNKANREFCDKKVRWVGITCKDEEIKRVQFSFLYYGNFNIQSLPHSVTIIDIVNCEQHFAIETRALPKNLLVINLKHNRIYGTPDLRNLPDIMTEANFSNNQMWGPIDLTQLPRNLRILNLSFNRIQQDVVWYDNLPVSIKQICLEDFQDSNGIKQICPVNRRQAVRRGQVFFGDTRQ